MAIYSLNHSKIGRNTHAPGTAGAHLKYITRNSACRAVLGAYIPVPTPGKVGKAKAWMDGHEENDRKNARVIDKFMFALPIELDAEQRMAVVRRFAERLTRGETPWLAAIHDKGKDKDNPHCHFVLRDRHVATGKRALGMSERGSTERVRELWEQVANEALEVAGVDARIDRRTLKAQGIDRDPQKHIGPAAKAVEADERASWKLEAIRDEEQAEDARKEALSAPEGAEVAIEAEEALMEAQAAQRAAERSLSKARQNLRNAEEILSGKRELFTGELKPSDDAYVIQGKSGLDMSEDEIAHEEYLAQYCDADGNEMIPHIRPALSDYGDTDREQQIYKQHFAEWQTVERVRADRAEKNKRRIWEEEFPQKRQQLQEINRMNVTQIVGKVLDAARSIFKWMRDRVAAAKQTLGEKHALTKQMQDDWSDVIVQNRKAHDLVVKDQLLAVEAVKVETQQAWALGSQRWQEVEKKRDAYRNPKRGPTKDNDYGLS